MKTLQKNNLLCALLCFCSSFGYSQQIPQFSQYMFNQTVYNPASVGTLSGINVEVAARNQWLRIEGLPLTQSIALHTPVPLFRGGVGVSVVNDMMGAQRNTSASVMYAYQQTLGAKSYLSIGIQAGIMQAGLQGDKLISPSGNYQGGIIDHQDALLPINTQQAILPNLGLGIQYQTKQLQIGIATHQLLGGKANWQTPTQSVNFLFKQHYLAQAAYNFNIGDNILLTPSLLFKTDLNSYQLDANLMACFNKKIWAGASFRGYNNNTIDAAIAMVGWQATRRLFVSQSYDISLSGLRTYNSGSLETMLRYNIPNKWLNSKGKSTYNPRFL